jgi:hypothetical protein
MPQVQNGCVAAELCQACAALQGWWGLACLDWPETCCVTVSASEASWLRETWVTPNVMSHPVILPLVLLMPRARKSLSRRPGNSSFLGLPQGQPSSTTDTSIPLTFDPQAVSPSITLKVYLARPARSPSLSRSLSLFLSLSALPAVMSFRFLWVPFCSSTR